MDFTDDIVSFDSNETAAGQQLQNLQKEAATVGTKINSDKPKIFLVNYQFSNQLPTSLGILEIVEDFKYLGAKITSSYDDFKWRRGIAWSQFWKLEKVWRPTKISLKLKFRLFDSLILSILLRGAESWTTTQKLKNKLNAFGTSCYKKPLNIRKIDRMTSQHILMSLRGNTYQRYFYQKQLLVLGHWLRRPPETTIKKCALYNTNQGRNSRGRPRATYVKLMEKLTGMHNHA